MYNTTIIREDPLFSFSRSKYSVSFLWRFLTLVSRFDIVFINSPSVNVLPVAIIAKLFRKKILIFHQGDLILPKGITNRVIEKIFDISSYIAFALSDKVSTYTQDYAEYSRVLKPFLKKITPLIFPIPIENEKSKKEDRQVKDMIAFGFAGRFVEEKGFDILLKAIPAIVKKIPNAHFFYAGETQVGYENFFEKNRDAFEKVKQYITVLGLLNNEQMKSFYASLDFLIVPSRSDCFNLVQAEAMKLGVPSVA